MFLALVLDALRLLLVDVIQDMLRAHQGDDALQVVGLLDILFDEEDLRQEPGLFFFLSDAKVGTPNDTSTTLPPHDQFIAPS